jgi:exodeoxyribonuclease-5
MAGDLGVEVKTIHSHANFIPKGINQYGEEVFEWTGNEPEYKKAVIIDEASMVPQEIYDIIKRNAYKVILLGDVNQLKAVNSKAVDTSKMETVILTENMRQEKTTSSLIQAIEAFREAIENNTNVDITKLDCDDTFDITTKHPVDEFMDIKSNNKIIIAATNAAVNRYNKKIKSIIGNDTYEVGDILMLQKPWHEEYIGENSIVSLHNGSLIELTSIRESLDYPDYFFVDFVVKNKTAKKYKNVFMPKKQYIHTEILKGELLACQQKRQSWNAYYKLKNQVLNVKHTFAITSHKAQGSTYDEVVVDYKDMLGILKWKGTEEENKDSFRRAMYVAISRAKRKVVLTT